jgi:hypothetical protein
MAETPEGRRNRYKSQPWWENQELKGEVVENLNPAETQLPEVDQSLKKPWRL